jgi:hypothetical protein
MMIIAIILGSLLVCLVAGGINVGKARAIGDAEQVDRAETCVIESAAWLVVGLIVAGAVWLWKAVMHD